MITKTLLMGSVVLTLTMPLGKAFLIVPSPSSTITTARPATLFRRLKNSGGHDNEGDPSLLERVVKLETRDEMIMASLARLENRFDEVDAKFEKLDAKMESGFKEVDAKFEKLNAKMESGFKEVDAKFEKLNAKMESGFKEVDAKFEKHDTKMESGFKEVNAKINALTFVVIVLAVLQGMVSLPPLLPKLV